MGKPPPKVVVPIVDRELYHRAQLELAVRIMDALDRGALVLCERPWLPPSGEK